MNTLITLEKARSLVKQGWCQKAFARAPDGKSVGAHSTDAIEWCVTGALQAASGFSYENMIGSRVAYADYSASRSMFKLANDIASDYTVMLWNDRQGRTQEQVISAFDKAVDYVGSK